MVNGVCWDGKTGIWPAGHHEPAKRNSKNRLAGTPEWKNDNINRDKCSELMSDLIMPATMAKFPTACLDRRGKGMRIQQDGARSHILEDDEEFLAAVVNQRGAMSPCTTNWHKAQTQTSMTWLSSVPCRTFIAGCFLKTRQN